MRLDDFNVSGTKPANSGGNVVKFDKVCRIIQQWRGNWFLRRYCHVPNQMH